MTLELHDDISGMVGELVWFDETPRVNPARVRPFIIAVLLLRGAVRSEEVIASMTAHVHPDDLKSWEYESTQLELVVAIALGDLIRKRILRDRGDGLFVLDASPEATRFAITATSALDAQLPDHLLQEVGRQHFTPSRHV